MQVLKKPKYRGLFHRAFIGAMGCMPVFQEFDLKGGAEHKGDFGAKREESVFASIMAEGGEVIFETLKYQAHFEGMARLGFRHRVAQAAHLAGWRLQDERRIQGYENRAITIRQLNDLSLYLQRLCKAGLLKFTSDWSKTKGLLGHRVAWSLLNMYIISAEDARHPTKKCHF
eukprot:s3634_g2.t1